MIYAPNVLTFAVVPSQGTRTVTSLVWANTITPTRVEWLWPGYIPLRKTSILQGDPGEGKSQIMIDIAARVTRGYEMPDGTAGTVGSVMWITTEDDASDTLRPRLEAANADLDRVAIIDENPGKALTLPSQIGELERQAKAINQQRSEAPLRLVVIDPLTEFLDRGLNLNSAEQARKFFKPLGQFAKKYDCADVVIHHLNKAKGDQSALHRGAGSVAGIAGAARAVLHAGPGPSGSNEKVFAVVKQNLAKHAGSLRYRITGVRLAAPGGIQTSRIEWLGASAYSANDLVCAFNPDERTEFERATEFIEEVLAEGPRLVKDIEAQARQRGISVTGALRRAKDALNQAGRLRVEKTGDDLHSGWQWVLPE